MTASTTEPAPSPEPSTSNTTDQTLRHRRRNWISANGRFIVPGGTVSLRRVLLIGLALIAVGKVAGFYVHEALTESSPSVRDPAEILASLVVALGEALVVAWLVATTAERRLHRFFAEKLLESGKKISQELQEAVARATFWELTFKNAPREYIDSIQSLAAQSVFTTSAHYELSFDHVPEDDTSVQLTVISTSTIQNFGVQPFDVKPIGILVSSLEPHHSEWLQALYECVSQDFRLDYIREGLADVDHDANGYASFVGRDGSPTLSLQPGESARIELVGRLWRAKSSSLPLWNRRPALKVFVSLRGSALPELQFKISPRGVPPTTQPGPDHQLPAIECSGDRLKECRSIPLGGVFLVGQNVEIVWWTAHKQ